MNKVQEWLYLMHDIWYSFTWFMHILIDKDEIEKDRRGEE